MFKLASVVIMQTTKIEQIQLFEVPKPIYALARGT